MRRIRHRHGLIAALVALGAIAAAALTVLGDDAPAPTAYRDSLAEQVGARAEQAKRGKRGRRGKRGPRGRRGKRGRRGPQGPSGPQGPPGSNNERVISMVVEWTGLDDAAGNDRVSRSIPGIGRLELACPTTDGANYPGDRTMTLSNGTGDRRVVATMTSFLDDSLAGENVANARQQDPPGQISFGLPQNGMMSGNLSVEPISGDGIPPGALTNASILLSSYYQTNDPGNPENNWCHISAQVVVKGAP